MHGVVVAAVAGQAGGMAEVRGEHVVRWHRPSLGASYLRPEVVRHRPHTQGLRLRPTLGCAASSLGVSRRPLRRRCEGGGIWSSLRRRPMPRCREAAPPDAPAAPRPAREAGRIERLLSAPRASRSVHPPRAAPRHRPSASRRHMKARCGPRCDVGRGHNSSMFPRVRQCRSPRRH